MEKLRQRADFLATANGLRVNASAFVLQVRARGDDGPARIGLTVSRKVGNAVERNRVRRRLRDMVRRADADDIRPGHDYVLVARRIAISESFNRLAEDFTFALQRYAAGRAQPARRTDNRRRAGGGKEQLHARADRSGAPKGR
jgi:ribonuclease P protein component